MVQGPCWPGTLTAAQSGGDEAEEREREGEGEMRREGGRGRERRARLRLYVTSLHRACKTSTQYNTVP